MNTIQIKCFLAAAERLSFTEAASRLYISQPAFSRNIASLEKEWGVELFLRGDKRESTRLTAAGSELFEGISELSLRYNELVQHARETGSGKQGRLTIGLLDGNRIDDRERRLLRSFSELYPGVDVVLRRGQHSELIQWLWDKTVDLAFTLKIDVSDRDWISSYELYSTPSVLLVPADHPLAGSVATSLADFRDEAFLSLSSKESEAVHSLLLHECEKLGFVPRVIDCSGIQEQIVYVESGRGVAIGSENNTAAYSSAVTMLKLPELRPLVMAAAWSNASDNTSLKLFIRIIKNDSE